MVVLSLDEYGDFEGVKNESDAILIAGVLYDNDDNKEDIENETRRIIAYYKQMTKEASRISGCTIRFPQDLHSDSRGSNKRQEKASKILVNETLGEFLKNGTYRGTALCDTPRRGHYKIYCMLKSDEGKKTRLSEDACDLVRDSHASNLYMHMVNEVLLRTVFQNIYLKRGADFRLDIATRKSAPLKRGSEFSRKYIKLGYTCTQKVKDKREEIDVLTKDGQKGEFFELTNKDIYRTAVSHFLVDRNYMDVNISDLKVHPINYKGDTEKNAFLYLADSVCAILSYELKKIANTAESWMKEIYSRALELLPDDALLIFAYDAIDIELVSALDAYNAGDYYTALSHMYEICNQKGVFAEFYKEHWVARLENLIIKDLNKRNFVSAVNTLNDSQLSNDLQVSRCRYIFDILERKAHYIKQEFRVPESRSVFYRLYVAGIVVYNHLGDPLSAMRFLADAEQYVHRVPLEEHLRTLNMVSVASCDYFDYEKAKLTAQQSIDLQEKIQKLQQEVYPPALCDGFAAGAKAYSQMGQVCAFMRSEKANDYFKRSLLMHTEESANYYITMSYYLHFLIDCKDIKLYERYMKDYLGTSDIVEQYNQIEEEKNNPEPLYNYGFAMYLYLKGIYSFKCREISDALWKKIKNIDIKDDHPYELICKYICLIAIAKKDEVTLKKYSAYLRNTFKDSKPLISAIVDYAMMTVADKAGDNKLFEMHGKKLSADLAELKKWEKDASLNCSEIYKRANEVLTYMYQ